MTHPDPALHLWLAGLAGEATRPGGASANPGPWPEQADGAALRQLIHAHRAQREQGAQTPSAASEAAHWQRLRLRLLPALLASAEATNGSTLTGDRVTRAWPGLPPRGSVELRMPVQARWWCRSARDVPPWSRVAGAAAVTLVVLGLAHQLPRTPGGDDDSEAGPVMRGAEPSQVMSFANSAELEVHLARLEVLLREYQVPYRIDRNGSGAVIRAAVPAQVGQRSALQAQGLEIPDHGRLLVQLRILGQ